MDLHSLQAKRREIDIDFETEPGTVEKIHVAYAPHRYTSKVHMDFALLTNTGDPEALARVLSTVLMDWDLTNNKKPVPTTADGIIEQGVPFMLQLAVSRGITTDMNDQKNAQRSPAS